MTFGSLFSGIGGIDLGLERAGMECRWQVENDAFCSRVLEKHWPGVKRYGDIREVRGDELEPVDLICGGFPCQDLSQAGKRAGIEGTRSGLWFEFARIIGVLRPRFVLIENVPGLLVPGAMRRVVGELAPLGYVGSWRSLRAPEFGASHLRKRVFIVAYRKDNGRCGGADSRTDGERNLPQGKSDPDGMLRSEPVRCGDDMAYRKCSQWHPWGSQQGHIFGLGESGADVADRVSTRRQTAGIRRNLDAGSEFEAGGGDLADALSAGLEERGRIGSDDATQRASLERICGAFAPGPSDPRWPAILAARPDLTPALESPLRRVADGLSSDLDGAMRDRTKRLSRLGNAVVPQVAQWIGEKILAFEEET